MTERGLRRTERRTETICPTPVAISVFVRKKLVRIIVMSRIFSEDFRKVSGMTMYLKSISIRKSASVKF